MAAFKMMSNLNTPVRLSGFIAGDPQVRVTGDNRKVVRVRLAVNEKKNLASGNRAVVTHWHQLVSWVSQAEIAERQLRKGKAVSVAGR